MVESVATINADGSRRFVHPSDVRGRFTAWRIAIGAVLLAVYVVLPWIRINGYPAVFLDIANLQFHFFGLTFVTQDLWIAFFMVSGLAFSLFYVSALLGRVWCGWGCPQTVLLDFARRFERWIEGDAAARRRLDAARWDFDKTVRRGGSQLVFALFSLAMAHVLLSYFVSIPRLYEMMTQAPGKHWGVFVAVAFISAVLWFDFAWFREQFCIVLCPYGRLQSALIDSDSLVIGYDALRGEPRGRKSAHATGDCVDCRRCVQVCPTGIDIRKGLQMECIGCAACVDACDAVMTKLDRPRGLVRYDSMHGLARKPTRFLRPRIILYTALLALGASVMAASISTLRPVTVSITRMTGTPYVLSAGQVRNQFFLRVLNKRNSPQHFEVWLSSEAPHLAWSGCERGIDVGPLGEEQRPIVVVVPSEETRGSFPLKVHIKSVEHGGEIVKSVPFVGPGY